MKAFCRRKVERQYVQQIHPISCISSFQTMWFECTHSQKTDWVWVFQSRSISPPFLLFLLLLIFCAPYEKVYSLKVEDCWGSVWTETDAAYSLALSLSLRLFISHMYTMANSCVRPVQQQRKAWIHAAHWLSIITVICLGPYSSLLISLHVWEYLERSRTSSRRLQSASRTVWTLSEMNGTLLVLCCQ